MRLPISGDPLRSGSAFSSIEVCASFPIQPDYVGRFMPTTPREHVKVVLAPQPAATDEVAIVESQVPECEYAVA